VPGFLVIRGGRLVSIDLHEYEVMGVGEIPQYVEADHTRLFTTRHRVLFGRVQESLNLIGYDCNVHMDDKQGVCHELTLFSESVEIDAALVSRLIGSQFPQWSDLPITAAEPNGWDNRTFRLGPDLLVRLPSGQSYAAQVRKEHRWLPVLAPQLPLPIPVPVAMGEPAEEYPWNWSVYRWLDGVPASTADIDNLTEFGKTLAYFLVCLQRIDATGGPAPGPHNFFRGGPLETYDADTRDAIATVGNRIDAELATEVWEAGLAETWRGSPVWVHGDVAAGNLLVRDGRLAAVIDFGSSGVGDPACDVTIAWTFLSGGSREAFRAALPLDEATWARGRGWALWKALITYAGNLESDPAAAATARRVIDMVLGEHAHTV
jgi:aminoglycoside phosphotransferase (APT) family kinase protein